MDKLHLAKFVLKDNEYKLNSSLLSGHDLIIFLDDDDIAAFIALAGNEAPEKTTKNESGNVISITYHLS